MEAIKRNEAEILFRLLSECRKHLQLGRIYPCLLDFKDLLEKIIVTNMLSADEKQLTQDINEFQQQLAGSKDFKGIFGPITFHDNDQETTLAFIRQLIVVEEEEILTKIHESQNSGTGQKSDPADPGQLVHKIVMLIDRGQYEKARDIYADDETLRSLIVRQYNLSGISYRKEKRYAEAVAEFKKALQVEPQDEGLYYNMSRSYLEKGDLERAKGAALEALKINGDFKEGRDLLQHIEKLSGRAA